MNEEEKEGQGRDIVDKATPTEPIEFNQLNLKKSTALLKILLAIPKIPRECIEKEIELENIKELAEWMRPKKSLKEK